MVDTNTPQTVRGWLFDGREIALVDVRENGHYGDGHPLFAVSVPYSIFEARLSELVPNRAVRLVLYDNDDGIAQLAANRATDLGYVEVSIMAGGAAGWADAGYTLYVGANVPSKTFGELLELQHHTPNLTAEQVAGLKDTTPNHVIVDSRPYSEYSQFNIPGGICCPNGEVALRIGELVPDPATTIVVNCAGRTRSILGAETLRAFGVPNPVYALKNGTQGWLLAELQREEGANRYFAGEPKSNSTLTHLQAKVRACADRTGFEYITASDAVDWLADVNRTTFLFDVRSRDEFNANGIDGSRHVLGGQLVQATDEYIGVRGSRVILMDDEMVRAPMMANWIHQLGYEVAVLDGGVDALRGMQIPETAVFAPTPVAPMELPSANDPGNDLVHDPGSDLANATILDLRSIMSFRRGHIEGAVWTTRPLLETLNLSSDATVVLVATDDNIATLAAQRLSELGVSSVRRLCDDEDAWRAIGLEIVITDDKPLDAEIENLLFYVHQRNAPNSSKAAANAYLNWEIGLVDQLDAEERESFRLASNHIGTANRTSAGS